MRTVRLKKVFKINIIKKLNRIPPARLPKASNEYALFIIFDFDWNDRREARAGNKIPVIKQNGVSNKNELKNIPARLII
jgi:hypothetical protein